MINVQTTLNSGQVFLWERIGSDWYGIDGPCVLRVGEDGTVDSSGPAPDFFREGDDLGRILATLPGDAMMRGALKKYDGLRITRQDPFQCMISFVVSANSNIPRIRLNLGRLCRRFGDCISYGGMDFWTFPRPPSLASAAVSEIEACGTGYRSPYIRDAARSFAVLDVDDIRKMPYCEARAALVRIRGIGDKVADCILLFSMDFLEACPLDRWVVRIMHENYAVGTGRPPHTRRQYDLLHEQVLGCLGPYAGYGQQYLFRAIRDTKPLKW